jgi:type II secretory pathway pseudopilin PulG
LLELLLVLLLLAILSTLAAVSLASSLRSASLRNVIDQIIFADAQSRTLAKHLARPVRLTIHPDTGTIIRIDSTGPTTLATLPSYIRIDQFLVAGDSQISISTRAESPTYAIHLRAPRTKPTWLLISGPTGIPLETQNDSEIHDIFAHLAQSRDSAAPTSGNPG